MGVYTGDYIDVYRAVYRDSCIDNYRAFLVYQCCVLVEPQSSVLSFKQSFEQIFKLKGETPLDPPAYCVLYLPRRQSSCRGFGRVFSRAFIELYMEVCVELLQSFYRAFVELLQSFCRALVELWQSFVQGLIQSHIQAFARAINCRDVYRDDCMGV